MSASPEALPRTGGRSRPAFAVVLALVLSACGSSPTPDALLTAPGDNPADSTAAAEASVVVATTSEPAPTETVAPVALPLGPPTTSPDASQPSAGEPAAEADTATDAAGAEPVAAAPAPEEPTTSAPQPESESESTTVSAAPTTSTTAAPVTQPAPDPTAAPTTTTAPSTTTTTVPSEPPPVEIVEFRIAPGTGRQPWNSFDNPVRVRVGQILRVHNDDSEVHTIHAGGSPFKHGSRIDPGNYRDHPVLSPHQPVEGSPQVYDHNNGRGTPFWVVAEG